MLFFKQKTAYEMRISDWSSDVCSSDLQQREHADRMLELERPADLLARRPEREQRAAEQQRGDDGAGGIGEGFDLRAARVAARPRETERLEAEDREDARPQVEIGRASCRERVCQYG